MPSICFVGVDTYPVLNPDARGHYIGGESVQLALLCKGFRDLGYDVTLIEKDYGQPSIEVIDGITVLKTFTAKKGIPGLRYIHPRITKTLRVMMKVNADIYYQSTASMMSGLTAFVCKRGGHKFAFRVAHDTDCIRDEQLIRWWHDRKLYEFGIRNADMIFSQSETQQQLLRENYALDSCLMDMAVDLPSEEDLALEQDIDVLWVNNMREFKRPELYLELARSLPHLKFTMIGGPTPDFRELYDRMAKEAREICNLDFKGPVAYHEVNNYYCRAKVFVNTSDTEGFPNSFLQSWIRGVPVVSFFDPDGLIASEGLGVVPNNLSEMGQAVNDYVIRAKGDCKRIESIRDYAFSRFSPVSIARQYDSYIKAVSAK